MPNYREQRRKQITEQRSNQILEAALTVFTRTGYDRATMQEVAREADIAVGTIYIYYPSKHDLLLELYKQYLFQPFKQAFTGISTGHTAVTVTDLILERLQFGHDNLDRFIPLLMEIQRDPELRQRYSDELLRPVLKMAEGFLASRMESGDVRQADPAVVTRAIGGMILGFMLLSRIEGKDSVMRTRSLPELAGELTSLVLNGLQHNPTDTP